MIYLVFYNPNLPAENKELVGLQLDVIEAQELAAELSLKNKDSIYEVYRYYPGKLSGHHWSCDDLIQDGKLSSTWKNGRAES